MRYQKADEIFPKELLLEIQKYAQGQIVYIPKAKGKRKAWGENSGNRNYLNIRNENICQKFSEGSTINQLADEFCLSIYSIKKIVYSRQCR